MKYRQAPPQYMNKAVVVTIWYVVVSPFRKLLVSVVTNQIDPGLTSPLCILISARLNQSFALFPAESCVAQELEDPG
jgi:hypothetical protein